MSNGRTTQRIGENFNQQIEHIKEQRLKLGNDEKKSSTRKLTDLLIKHDSWEIIKEDMIKFEFDK